MQREVAAEIIDLMREYSGELNWSIKLVKATCTNEEFLVYRRAAGRVMGELYTEVMWPIFHEHPDLEPEEMKPEKNSVADNLEDECRQEVPCNEK